MRLSKEIHTAENQAPKGGRILWQFSFHEINSTFNLLEKYKRELNQVLKDPQSSEFRKLKAIKRVQRTAKEFLNIEL